MNNFFIVKRVVAYESNELEKIFSNFEDAIIYAEKRMMEVYHENYMIRKKYKSKSYVLKKQTDSFHGYKIFILFDEKDQSEIFFTVLEYDVENSD